MMKNNKNKNFISKIVIGICFIFLLINSISAKTTYYWEMGPEYNENNYSDNKISQYVHEGIAVDISKTDAYDNNQDERMRIRLGIKNANIYSKSSIVIEALEHDKFGVLSNSKKEFVLNPNDYEEFFFNYYYKDAKGIDRDKYKDVNILPKMYPKNNLNEINIKEKISSTNEARNNISTHSEIDDKYNNGYINTIKIGNIQISKNIFIIIAIIIIVVVIIIVVQIIKYINTNHGLYGFAILFIISILLNITNTVAYDFQSFEFGKEYTHIYECTAYHVSIPYNLKFKISYIFDGNKPNLSKDDDSDGDGLKDLYEMYFLTDYKNFDTDGDGIPDGTEIYYIDTDPLKIDTNDDGINDGEEDFDKDKLLNIDEVKYGTSLINDDTDYDRLTDYDEVKIYNTNPLEKDTDNDGVSDYEEVEICKILNINYTSDINKTTKFEQKLSKDSMDEVFYKNNTIDIEVSGNLYGLIDKHVSLKNKSNVVVDYIDYIIEKPILINSDYEDEILTISFDLKNYSERINGIKVATIKEGKLEFLDFSKDENIISVNIKDGYVMLIDGIKLVGSIVNFNEDNYK